MKLPLRAIPMVVVESARDTYQLVLLALLAIGIVYAIATGETLGTKTLALGVIPILAVMAFRYYRNYHIAIEPDAICLRRGVLSNFEDRIRFERIERLSQNQNLLQQVFGLKTLRLHTLGNADKALELVQLTDEQVTTIVDAIPGVTLQQSQGAHRARVSTLARAFFVLPSFKMRSFALGVMVVAALSTGIGEQTQRMDEAQQSASQADWSAIDIRSVEGALTYAPRGIETIPQMAGSLLLVFVFAAGLGKFILFVLAYYPFRWHIDEDGVVRFEHGWVLKHQWAMRPSEISFVTVYQGKWLRNPQTFALQITSIDNSVKPAILPALRRSDLMDILGALAMDDPRQDHPTIKSSISAELKLGAFSITLVGAIAGLFTTLMTPQSIASIDWVSWMYAAPGALALLMSLAIIRNRSNRLTIGDEVIAVDVRSLYGETILFPTSRLAFVDSVQSPVEGKHTHTWGFHVGERRIKASFLPCSASSSIQWMLQRDDSTQDTRFPSEKRQFPDPASPVADDNSGYQHAAT